MAVDVVFPGWIPFKKMAHSADVPQWIAAQDEILEYDFGRLVAGHLGRLGDRDDVLTQQAYLKGLVAATRRGLESVSFADAAAAANVAEPWAIIDAYTKLVANEAERHVPASWSERLSAYDVYTRSHLEGFVEVLLTDSLP